MGQYVNIYQNCARYQFGVNMLPVDRFAVLVRLRGGSLSLVSIKASIRGLRGLSSI